MKILLLLLIGVSLCSCSSSVQVETSGLVINERKGEFSLNGQEISEEQAEEYITKNSKSDKIVVVVEGNEIGVYTVNELNEITSALIRTLFSPNKQSLKPNSSK